MNNIVVVVVGMAAADVVVIVKGRLAYRLVCLTYAGHYRLCAVGWRDVIVTVGQCGGTEVFVDGELCF